NGFGKNIYQFGNPYLTNLDLRSLFVSSDINYVSNLYGIRVEPASGVVSYSPNVGGNGNTTPRYITWSGGNLVGDVEWAMLRPMSVFAMKLNDNSAGKSINFDNLRRFKYTPRTSGAYDVTAKANNTVKQLGVIALDATGFEIGRTYYVVSPTAVNGNAPGITMQTQAETTNVIGTFEEDPINGGYDMNLISNYWLYINEANEITFKGKAIPGALYSQNIKSLKFEIRENEALIPNGNTTLSTGIGFYYKLENGTVQSIAQNQTVPVTVGSQGLEVNLYYGAPTAALATDDVKTKPSRTMVVYNPTIDNFVVLFDPNWKKADVKVYDMSGKLVLSANKVDTNKDFVIDLMKGNKGFVVSVTSETGTVVNAKIIR
ncbi:MAG: T9SS type A sorting domain-containing protein, partial [Bacteroidetes bacterium]|nr:T9SS type A sorting domain-containing protein [Bacteroidota bacterium]